MTDGPGWTVEALVQGFPGKATEHGGLGWSGITLLRGDGRVVLVDTGGFGVRAPLARRLGEHGVEPGDVTDVLLTHVHYDHAVNALLFPRATLWISAADLEWACTREPAFDPVPELYARALDGHPRTRRIDASGGPVLPGVAAIPAPGHTPGCLLYRVDAADGPVLFAGDAVKNRAELLSGEVDMTVDAAASAASVRMVRDLFETTPGAVLVPGHDVPMRIGADGRPEYLEARAAGITAWFGADLADTTTFDLARRAGVTPPGRTAVPVADLDALARAALTAGGMPADGAADVARVLVLADRFGIATHGVRRIPQYLERARLGGLDPAAEVVTETVAPALARVDGRNGVGPLVGMHALRAALAGARQAGIGAAFARASNHFGPVMPYLFLAAEEGFAAIVASNATTTIAPWGGRAARLGNNPLGLGVPNPGGDPILLDVAMSVVARAKIRDADAAGEAIPDTWATDRDGAPTTDPAAALDGFLLPVGGHKGYGLALLVDLFAGVLSGASYLARISSWSEDPGRAQDLGHVFLLVDAGRLSGDAALGARVEDFAAILHDTPPADPDVPVQVPGEREMAAYHASGRDGVALGDADLAALRALAEA